MVDNKNKKHGKLLVISAPSGAGKTTLVRYLRQAIAGLGYSISYTTRPIRKGEVDGRDYHFVNKTQFKQMIAENKLLEWAEVHGHYYGTGLAYVKHELAQGNNLLLEIDVQGARQICSKGLDCITIFIMPPSLETLQERLIKRDDVPIADLALRMQNAVTEMHQKDFYQHVIVNDNLQTAENELYNLVQSLIN